MQVRMRAATSALVVASLAAAFACTSATQPACDICAPNATVLGTVTSTSGAQLQRVGIRLDVRTPDCAQSLNFTTGTQTDPSGQYSGYIFVVSPLKACVIVSALPSPTSGFAGAVDTVPQLDFRNTWEPGVAADQARVDFVLQPLP